MRRVHCNFQKMESVVGAMKRRRLWTAGILIPSFKVWCAFSGHAVFPGRMFVNDLTRKAANHRSSSEPAAARNDEVSYSL